MSTTELTQTNAIARLQDFIRSEYMSSDSQFPSDAQYQKDSGDQEVEVTEKEGSDHEVETAMQDEEGSESVARMNTDVPGSNDRKEARR